jgi:hypothetical protein
MEQTTKPLQKEEILEDTIQRARASLSRRSFLWKGLAIGGVTIGTELVTSNVSASAKELNQKNVQISLAGQSDWRWCNKCQGLFFAGNSTTGTCPTGGGHNYSGSGNYSLGDFVGGSFQDRWRWCNKCQGLFFAGNPTSGVCPAGGGHNYSGSQDYYLNEGVTVRGQQSDWHWCNKCQGLFFAGNPTSGVCPAGGSHNDSGSGNYSLSDH